MFVSVLCSILKYKLLLGFFVFVLSSKIFYLTLCQLNLYFLCLFLSFVSVQSFYMPPWPIFEKVLNPVSRSWVFQLAKSWNSKQWSVGLFGKDLKSSFFLGHIYVVLFVELHTFSFLFFNLLINHFSLSIRTLNSHGVNYILRKPIVPQPQASTLYSCGVQRKLFLQLTIRARWS